MSINHGHMCSKSFLTCSHLWFFNYKQKIFTRKLKKRAHKYIMIRLSFACIRQNFWIDDSPGHRLQDVSVRVFTNTGTNVRSCVRWNLCTVQDSRLSNWECRCLIPNTGNRLSLCSPGLTLRAGDTEKKPTPSETLDKQGHIYWMRFILTTKKF